MISEVIEGTRTRVWCFRCAGCAEPKLGKLFETQMQRAAGGREEGNGVKSEEYDARRSETLVREINAWNTKPEVQNTEECKTTEQLRHVARQREDSGNRKD